MQKTDGQWDKSDRFVYFLAASLGTLQHVSDMADYMLVAVNELFTDESANIVQGFLDSGKRILLDSGIFWLTNKHARKYGVPMDVALTLRPEDIEDFDKLFDRYVDLAVSWKDQLWGYIELDQGGEQNKRKTRAILHERHLYPMPVYHPISDGWNYFDELACNYDRICCGNVVQANRDTRRKLISTFWERHTQYPDLWIHLLGITPCNFTSAYPVNSCDSSSWISGTRWGRTTDLADCRSGFALPRQWVYQPKTKGYEKGIRLEAMIALSASKNWKNKMSRLWELGVREW